MAIHVMAGEVGRKQSRDPICGNEDTRKSAIVAVI
jgi:hypothetical protein